MLYQQFLLILNECSTLDAYACYLWRRTTGEGRVHESCANAVPL